MSPLRLFRAVAVTEAITWGLLLIGMFVKYGLGTTEVGVQVAGPIHGVAFVAYCVSALVVAVDQQWSGRRLLLALVSSVPPFVTLLFERYAESRGLLAPAWRLATGEPGHARERLVAALVRRPLAGLGVGVLIVAALTGLALLVGPPGT